MSYLAPLPIPYNLPVRRDTHVLVSDANPWLQKELTEIADNLGQIDINDYIKHVNSVCMQREHLMPAQMNRLYTRSLSVPESYQIASYSDYQANEFILLCDMPETIQALLAANALHDDESYYFTVSVSEYERVVNYFEYDMGCEEAIPAITH